MMIDRGVERAEEVFGRWKEREGEEFLECARSLAAGETMKEGLGLPYVISAQV